MAWTIKWEKTALKELKKIDKALQKSVMNYLNDRLLLEHDPRKFGKPLAYDKFGLWRYRVQNVRIICQILDDELLILVVRVGTRAKVYNF